MSTFSNNSKTSGNVSQENTTNQTVQQAPIQARPAKATLRRAPEMIRDVNRNKHKVIALKLVTHVLSFRDRFEALPRPKMQQNGSNEKLHLHNQDSR